MGRKYLLIAHGEMKARDVIYKLCGWSIRHFMILRNNYFGSFTHFSTLYEYLAKRRQKQPLGDPVDLQYREGGVSETIFLLVAGLTPWASSQMRCRSSSR